MTRGQGALARVGLLVGGLGLSLLAGGRAQAQDGAADATTEQLHEAQVDELRAEMTNRIHLQANDLVDELVFSWLESPPFDSPTPVVLADVIAPVGYGSGLEALIENHLAELLIKNPQSQVQLAHCPACQALVVHSGPEATVLGKGFDQPEALKKLRGSSGAEHALFLDFEAEGSALVLRARITKLAGALPIVYARTLSTQTLSAPLLRTPGKLVSAEETREDYVALLEQRGPLRIPVRLAMSGLAPSDDQMLSTPIPIPWLQVGLEYAVSSARAWKGSLIIGATFIPTLHSGVMIQGRASRLITGSSVSLTHPNVYAFAGAALAVLQGQTATLLNVNPPMGDDPFGPIATYLSLQYGLEVRVSKRIGASFFFETMPTLYGVDNVGNYLDNFLPGVGAGVYEINSVGAEATFAF